MDEWMNGRTKDGMKEGTIEWMNGWMKGRTNERMNE
jgi:hypothetical protein